MKLLLPNGLIGTRYDLALVIRDNDLACLMHVLLDE